MQHDEVTALASARIRSFAIEESRGAGFRRDGGYFPAIYYPPITRYPEASQDEIFRDFTFAAESRHSLYFHLPFCPRRCAYCHWVVSVGNSAAEVDRYLDALRREVRTYKDLLGGPVISPTSILVGGALPDALPAQTERFLRAIAEDFDLGSCRQITCETEPTTILGGEGRAKLRAMKDRGVNRISLGVQSFDDGIPRGTGRLHSSRDAREALRAIRAAGFESVSIDLIYGYPGSTLKKWEETLMTAASLGVDAYQLYRLRIVPHGARPGRSRRCTTPPPRASPAGGDLPDEGAGPADLGAERLSGKLRGGCSAAGRSTTRSTCRTTRTGSPTSWGSASPRGTTSRTASSSTPAGAWRTITPPSTGDGCLSPAARSRPRMTCAGGRSASP